MKLLVTLLAGALADDAIVRTRFRPPALPLITTDPFMQTWIKADDAAGATVEHWVPGQAKPMVRLGAERM